MMLEIYKDNFIVSLSLFIMLLFYFFKPKKINSWYGYRTINSMKNQANWDFAQGFCSKYLIIFLTFLLIIQYPIYLLFNNYSRASFIITLLWFVILISVILSTENKLKKMNN